MKRFLLIFMSLVLLMTIIGCNPKKEVQTTSQGDFPVRIKDAANQEVTIKAKPKRIVSLSPSNTEILFALGLDEEIVGVTSYCDQPEKAKQKEKIGNVKTTNTEKVVSLKPDLVVASASLNDQAVKALRELGITVLTVEPKNVEQIFDAIALIAKATGTQAKGGEVIEGMRDTLAVVSSKLSRLDPARKAKVFIEVGYDPLYTAGKNCFVDDLVKLAGGINVVSNLEKYKQYSFEQLLAVNPQVILALDYYRMPENQKIEKRPGWGKIEAVKNGRLVVDIEANLLSRPGPRSADAVKAIAEAFYPELFK